LISGVFPTVVRLGDLNLDHSVNDGVNPEDFEIKRFIVHPEYNHTMKHNDIALIELSRTVLVSKTSYIRPACMQQDENYNKTLVTVRGLT
jgi:hypothetical protein